MSVTLSGEGLRELFANVHRSAFRMETHPVYAMPAESDSLRRFLAGEEKPTDFNTAWTSLVGRNAAAGKTMQRVKVVRHPLSDYTRFLLGWAIPDNVFAGEDYRILDGTNRANPVPHQDFWIFDESTVALLNFDADGVLTGRELLESPEIEEYLRLRDDALSEAVTFGEYRAREHASQ